MNRSFFLSASVGIILVFFSQVRAQDSCGPLTTVELTSDSGRILLQTLRLPRPNPLPREDGLAPSIADANYQLCSANGANLLPRLVPPGMTYFNLKNLPLVEVADQLVNLMPYYYGVPATRDDRKCTDRPAPDLEPNRSERSNIVVDLPAGEIFIKHAIAVCPNCILRGQGIGKTIIRREAVADVPENVCATMVHLKSGARLENLSVVGTWSGEQIDFNKAKEFGVSIGSRNVAIINVEIKNHTAQGIVAAGAKAACLYGIRASSNGHRAINIGGGSSYFRVYNLKSDNAHYAHFLVGDGAHHVELKQAVLQNMSGPEALRKPMLWVLNNAHANAFDDIVMIQNQNTELIPRGIYLAAGARENSFKNVRMRGLWRGIEMVSKRIDLSYKDLRNFDVRDNSFSNIEIKRFSLPVVEAAIVLASSRNYVLSDRSTRSLKENELSLMSRIRSNSIDGLQVEGYQNLFVEKPIVGREDAIPTYPSTGVAVKNVIKTNPAGGLTPLRIPQIGATNQSCW